MTNRPGGAAAGRRIVRTRRRDWVYTDSESLGQGRQPPAAKSRQRPSAATRGSGPRQRPLAAALGSERLRPPRASSPPAPKGRQRRPPASWLRCLPRASAAAAPHGRAGRSQTGRRAGPQAKVRRQMCGAGFVRASGPGARPRCVCRPCFKYPSPSPEAGWVWQKKQFFFSRQQF